MSHSMRKVSKHFVYASQPRAISNKFDEMGSIFGREAFDIRFLWAALVPMCKRSFSMWFYRFTDRLRLILHLRAIFHGFAIFPKSHGGYVMAPWEVTQCLSWIWSNFLIWYNCIQVSTNLQPFQPQFQVLEVERLLNNSKKNTSKDSTGGIPGNGGILGM